MTRHFGRRENLPAYCLEGQGGGGSCFIFFGLVFLTRALVEIMAVQNKGTEKA